jgi:hypothetical protein
MKASGAFLVYGGAGEIRRPAKREIRSTKSEIRNKFKAQRGKHKSGEAPSRFVLSPLRFGFVPDFVLRISDFRAAGFAL